GCVEDVRLVIELRRFEASVVTLPGVPGEDVGIRNLDIRLRGDTLEERVDVEPPAGRAFVEIPPARQPLPERILGWAQNALRAFSWLFASVQPPKYSDSSSKSDYQHSVRFDR